MSQYNFNCLAHIKCIVDNKWVVRNYFQTVFVETMEITKDRIISDIASAYIGQCVEILCFIGILIQCYKHGKKYWWVALDILLYTTQWTLMILSYNHYHILSCMYAIKITVFFWDICKFIEIYGIISMSCSAKWPLILTFIDSFSQAISALIMGDGKTDDNVNHCISDMPKGAFDFETIPSAFIFILTIYYHIASDNNLRLNTFYPIAISLLVTATSSLIYQQSRITLVVLLDRIWRITTYFYFEVCHVVWFIICFRMLQICMLFQINYREISRRKMIWNHLRVIRVM